MHVVPFTISGYTFTHVEEGDALDRPARDRWTELHDLATEAWRGEPYEPCDISEGETVFAITDSSGERWGTLALYRQRPIDPSTPQIVSALVAPMFPEIELEIPGEAIDPNGLVVNAHEILEAEERRATFWRRTFGIIEHLVENGLELEDGGVLEIDHIRFPQTEDGDTAQHQWTNVREFFDRYMKLVVTFDDDDRALRTVSIWKLIDPDPARARGSFDA